MITRLLGLLARGGIRWEGLVDDHALVHHLEPLAGATPGHPAGGLRLGFHKRCAQVVGRLAPLGATGKAAGRSLFVLPCHCSGGMQRSDPVGRAGRRSTSGLACSRVGRVGSTAAPVAEGWKGAGAEQHPQCHPQDQTGGRQKSKRHQAANPSDGPGQTAAVWSLRHALQQLLTSGRPSRRSAAAGPRNAADR